MVRTAELALDFRLQSRARQEGMTVRAYMASRLEKIVAPKANRAAIALLDAWEEEDATESGSEIEQRRADWEEMKTALNSSHDSDRTLFP